MEEADKGSSASSSSVMSSGDEGSSNGVKWLLSCTAITGSAITAETCKEMGAGITGC